ncbi:MAG: ribosome-associated translation inhibitor RaiA [Gammaproteobacteria bacterium]|nr:ribosome-associated translation inhibitor RaiA [Gammaproteobacteria bacterium]
MMPIQITIRDFPQSTALEDTIKKRAEKLEQFYQRIIQCRIVVEFAQKHKHQGKLFNFRIAVSVPRKEIVSTKKHHEDIYVAMRDAFEVIERKLEELANKRNGQVKRHEETIHGMVKRLVTEEGFGFIEGADGKEYYFSITSVIYPQLAIGDAVEFFAEEISDGHKANHIVKEGRYNVA